MARYTEAACRLCRRENKKLFLKGERCYTEKCAVTRRASLPGQHGRGRKKTSEYGIQLRAKQTARRYYGVLESQFATYFEKAAAKPGITGENLLQMLETRLDNVVYRLGFASSRKEARQLVRHGHFIVNERRVNIPSAAVKPGDIVSVAQKSRQLDKIKGVIEQFGSRPVPKWLDLDRDNATGRIVELPRREDIDLDVEEHLIVELYSK
jgi:small subunit ribosomal protein S4